MSKVIRYEEGFRERAYYCSEGYPTIGYGTKLGPRHTPLTSYTFKVSKDSAKELLEDYLEDITEYLEGMFGDVDINTARWGVLESMCYQLGISGFHRFKNTRKAIHASEWKWAATEMLDSRWASPDQTPERAQRHAEVMRSGTLDVYNDLI